MCGRNLSSLLTPTAVAGVGCLPPEILAEIDPPIQKTLSKQLPDCSITEVGHATQTQNSVKVPYKLFLLVKEC